MRGFLPSNREPKALWPFLFRISTKRGTLLLRWLRQFPLPAHAFAGAADGDCALASELRAVFVPTRRRF